MINYIWFGMIALSVVCAAVNGRLSELSSAVMDGAGDAVELSIFLLGSMCAWLGFFKIARPCGPPAAAPRPSGCCPRYG